MPAGKKSIIVSDGYNMIQLVLPRSDMIKIGFVWHRFELLRGFKKGMFVL